jgi:ATP-dependent 26S proteasome regulatory subunit
MPNIKERHEIWKSAVPPKAALADDVDLWAIAVKYELSGSAVVSVIHYASLQTIYRNSTIILKQDIIEGIKREYEKEERVFNG